MKTRRVVVTGIGALTPIGNNKADYWKSLIEGVSGADLITNFDTTNFKSAKYIIRASSSTDIHCSEVLLLAGDDTVFLTQYGVLGDSSLLSLSADIVSGTVGLSGVTSDTLEVSVYKFLLS